MPMDAILVSIGVCVMFLLFAFVVAWADHTTSRWLRDKAATAQVNVKADAADRRAA